LISDRSFASGEAGQAAAMPDGSAYTPGKPTFNTLEREKTFRNPPKEGSAYSVLNEFVAPHIESFNALFDDSGLPLGDGDGRGLISLAIKDIGERVVFDGNAHGSDARGNRIRGAFLPICTLHPLTLHLHVSSLDRTGYSGQATSS
jgi:DNA-directed RNA polymerase I subunit RPA2